MKNYNLLIILGILINLIISACAGTPTPDVDATVQAAVAATQIAQPTDTPDVDATVQAAIIATQTAQPTDTPDVDATVQAAVEATQIAQPTATPEPATIPTETPTPIPNSPTPLPTATPVPPTPTFTLEPPSTTSTPPPSANTSTPAPPTFTPTLAPPTATPTPSVLPAPVLLEPVELETIYAWFDKRHPATFRWRWDGQLPPNATFELRIWLEDIDPTSMGAYDAKKMQDQIINEGGGIYSVTYSVREAQSVRREYSTYSWTMAVIQIEPYERIGLEAEPRLVHIEYIDPPNNEDE